MLKIFLPIVLLAAVVVGCVTSADLQELADIHGDTVAQIQEAQVEYQASVDALLADTSLTAEERAALLDVAAKMRNESVKDITERSGASLSDLIGVVKDRTSGLGTVTGNALIDILLSIFLGGGAGAVAVDRLRERRRVMRGEVTGITPATD